jgi:putative DNA primase/helicase
MMDIGSIARVLGGQKIGRDSCNVPGPGHSRCDRSLSITIRRGRLCVFSHAGDDWKQCRDYVQEKLGLEARTSGDRRRQIFTVAASQTAAEEKTWSKAKALEIWHSSVDPRGTLVETYLQDHRGLRLPDDIAGRVIRFHGSLWFDKDTRLPGMICLFRNIKTDEPCGIHRTFLDRDTAQKIDRRMFGIAKAAAIKFDAIDIGDDLTCGEGIESCLTAREGGLGRVWALGSSGAVGSLSVLPLSEITLLQENDATSRRDTATCAKRYLNAGKPVTIVKSRVGNDLNDVWRFGRQVS